MSNAAMEHVDGVDPFGGSEPESTYRRTTRMLRKGGAFVHAIGLNSHMLASQQNGQYTYSRLVWQLIRGRTKYLINRWPASRHETFLRQLGLDVHAVHYGEPSRLSRTDLARDFRYLSDDDLETLSDVIYGWKR